LFAGHSVSKGENGRPVNAPPGLGKQPQTVGNLIFRRRFVFDSVGFFDEFPHQFIKEGISLHSFFDVGFPLLGEEEPGMRWQRADDYVAERARDCVPDTPNEDQANENQS
jgi:hypothetical protein